MDRFWLWENQYLSIWLQIIKKKKTDLTKLHTPLRVCLFEGEMRRMEKFREKIGEKMNLCVVWLVGGERKLLCGAQTFSTRAHKNFSPQNGEKIGEKMLRPAV